VGAAVKAKAGPCGQPVGARTEEGCGATTLSGSLSRPKEGRRGGMSWAASRLSAGRERKKGLGWPRVGLEKRKKRFFSKINPFPFLVFKSKPNSNEI